MSVVIFLGVLVVVGRVSGTCDCIPSFPSIPIPSHYQAAPKSTKCCPFDRYYDIMVQTPEEKSTYQMSYPIKLEEISKPHPPQVYTDRQYDTIIEMPEQIPQRYHTNLVVKLDKPVQHNCVPCQRGAQPEEHIKNIFPPRYHEYTEIPSQQYMRPQCCHKYHSRPINVDYTNGYNGNIPEKSYDKIPRPHPPYEGNQHTYGAIKINPTHIYKYLIKEKPVGQHPIRYHNTHRCTSRPGEVYRRDHTNNEGQEPYFQPPRKPHVDHHCHKCHLRPEEVGRYNTKDHGQGTWVVQPKKSQAQHCHKCSSRPQHHMFNTNDEVTVVGRPYDLKVHLKPPKEYKGQGKLDSSGQQSREPQYCHKYSSRPQEVDYRINTNNPGTLGGQPHDYKSQSKPQQEELCYNKGQGWLVESSQQSSEPQDAHNCHKCNSRPHNVDTNYGGQAQQLRKAQGCHCHKGDSSHQVVHTNGKGINQPKKTLLDFEKQWGDYILAVPKKQLNNLPKYMNDCVVFVMDDDVKKYPRETYGKRQENVPATPGATKAPPLLRHVVQRDPIVQAAQKVNDCYPTTAQPLTVCDHKAPQNIGAPTQHCRVCPPCPAQPCGTPSVDYVLCPYYETSPSLKDRLKMAKHNKPQETTTKAPANVEHNVVVNNTKDGNDTKKCLKSKFKITLPLISKILNLEQNIELRSEDAEKTPEAASSEEAQVIIIQEIPRCRCPCRRKNCQRCKCRYKRHTEADTSSRGGLCELLSKFSSRLLSSLIKVDKKEDAPRGTTQDAVVEAPKGTVDVAKEKKVIKKYKEDLKLKTSKVYQKFDHTKSITKSSEPLKIFITGTVKGDDSNHTKSTVFSATGNLDELPLGESTVDDLLVSFDDPVYTNKYNYDLIEDLRGNKINDISLREKRDCVFGGCSSRDDECPCITKLVDRPKYTNQQLGDSGVLQYLPEIGKKASWQQLSTSEDINHQDRPIVPRNSEMDLYQSYQYEITPPRSGAMVSDTTDGSPINEDEPIKPRNSQMDIHQSYQYDITPPRRDPTSADTIEDQPYKTRNVMDPYQPYQYKITPPRSDPSTDQYTESIGEFFGTPKDLGNNKCVGKSNQYKHYSGAYPNDKYIKRNKRDCWNCHMDDGAKWDDEQRDVKPLEGVDGSSEVCGCGCGRVNCNCPCSRKSSTESDNKHTNSNDDMHSWLDDPVKSAIGVKSTKVTSRKVSYEEDAKKHGELNPVEHTSEVSGDVSNMKPKYTSSNWYTKDTVDQLPELTTKSESTAAHICKQGHTSTKSPSPKSPSPKSPSPKSTTNPWPAKRLVVKAPEFNSKFITEANSWKQGHTSTKSPSAKSTSIDGSDKGPSNTSKPEPTAADDLQQESNNKEATIYLDYKPHTNTNKFMFQYSFSKDWIFHHKRPGNTKSNYEGANIKNHRESQSLDGKKMSDAESVDEVDYQESSTNTNSNSKPSEGANLKIHGESQDGQKLSDLKTSDGIVHQESHSNTKSESNKGPTRDLEKNTRNHVGSKSVDGKKLVASEPSDWIDYQKSPTNTKLEPSEGTTKEKNIKIFRESQPLDGKKLSVAGIDYQESHTNTNSNFESSDWIDYQNSKSNYESPEGATRNIKHHGESGYLDGSKLSDAKPSDWIHYQESPTNTNSNYEAIVSSAGLEENMKNRGESEYKDGTKSFHCHESPTNTKSNYESSDGTNGHGESHATKSDGFVDGDSNTKSSKPSLAGRRDGLPSLAGRRDGLPSLAGRRDGLPSLAGRRDGLPSLAGRRDGLPSLAGRRDGLPSLAGRRDGLPSLAGRRDGLQSLAGRRDGLATLAGSSKLPAETYGNTDSNGVKSSGSKDYLRGEDWLSHVEESLNDEIPIGDDIHPTEVDGDQVSENDKKTRRDGLQSLAGRRDGLKSLAGRRDGLPSLAGRRDGLPSLAGRRDGLPSLAGRRDGLLSLAGRRDGLISLAGRRDGLVTETYGNTDSNGVKSSGSKNSLRGVDWLSHVEESLNGEIPIGDDIHPTEVDGDRVSENDKKTISAGCSKIGLLYNNDGGSKVTNCKTQVVVPGIVKKPSLFDDGNLKSELFDFLSLKADRNKSTK